MPKPRTVTHAVEDRGHNTPCWIWQGAASSNGYGYANRDGECIAHRWYYKQHVGPLTRDQQLDHTCRVRLCVNPDHLEVVTQAQNVRRGLHSTLNEENVRFIRGKWGALDVVRGTKRQFCLAMAETFGVHEKSIQQVIDNKTWRGVA